MADNFSLIDLAVIPGDGIGPEIVDQGLAALEAALDGSGVRVHPTNYDLGAARYHRTGEILPEAELDSLKTRDAILLGAIGDPSVASGVLERGLLLRLRFALDHYVNLRPVKLFDGVASPLVNPGDIDFVVVREGTEGPYVGNGGFIRKGTTHEVATELSLNTAYGVERVVRFAFEVAAKRRRKHLTLVHKHNVLVHAGDLWRRTFERLATQYPQVSIDYMHVDAATIFFVTDPTRFDVIVTDNLFGDIVTDLAGAIVGGVGLAASGNINASREFPSMFEPIHGSAPDIAGLGIADPTATILSVAMMLDFLGHPDPADRLGRAIAADLAEHGPLGTNAGKARRTTVEIGRDILAHVADEPVGSDTPPEMDFARLLGSDDA